MKRTFLFLAILVIAAFLVGMALGQKRTDASADVRKVIEAYNADLGRYYASGDVDSIMSFFAEDARQMPPNGPALEGREKMRAFWKQAVSWGRWNFALTTVSVTANPPLAVELGRYKLQFTPGQAAPPGMKASVDTGNYVCYWRLDNDGKWRVVYDIATSDMNAQAELEKQNEATLRRLLEETDKGNYAFWSEVFVPEYQCHVPSNAKPLNLEEHIQANKSMYVAFPDFRHTIEDIFAKGDKAVFRATLRGTHKESFMGIPPTGKSIEYTAMGMARFRDGKIVEMWLEADFMGLMQQLGMELRLVEAKKK